MYKIVSIQGEKYIYFVNSQLIFQYDPDFEDILNDIINKSADEDLQSTEDYKLIKSILEEDEVANEKLDSIKRDKVKPDKLSLAGAQINVAYGCNMRCKYCFAEDGAHNKKGFMSNECAHNIIDFIKENSNSDLTVQLVGGEPLLNIKTFKELVDYSKKRMEKDIDLYTTTNGMCIDKEILEFFKKNEIKYMLSLDSYKRDVNDKLRVSRNSESVYDKIMGDFSKYREQYDYDTFHITVTPYNEDILDIAEFLYARGAKHLHFDLVKSEDEEFHFYHDDIEKIKNQYSSLAELIVKNISEGNKISCHPLTTHMGRLHKRKPIILKCGSLENFLAFDPSGTIYPCDMLMWDKYRLGDVKEDIDNKKLNELKVNLLDDSMCEKCWARYICGGLCVAEKILYKNQRDFMCEVREHVAKLKIYIYNRILQECPDFDFEDFM